jgi:hypothetical protein
MRSIKTDRLARVSVGTPPAVMVVLATRMLREAFDGPPGPWTYFIDPFPGTGVFGTISAVTAAQASQPAGPHNTTIAGHVQHLAAVIDMSARTLRGLEAFRDRSSSWTLTTVNEPAWSALQLVLRRAYEALVLALSSRRIWDEDTLGVAFGAIAHTAYHLGAMRQRRTD